MMISLPSKKVVRSPSGKVITKTDLAASVAKKSRVKTHAFIPGGKLEIIDTRYINQFVSPGFWLKRAVKKDELQAFKLALKDIERAKNNEFFTVIARQIIVDKVGLRIPSRVFDKQWLDRKHKSRIGGFVLTVYWLVLPIKNLLRKLRSETSSHKVMAWQWVEPSRSRIINHVLRDFMLLTQSTEYDYLEDEIGEVARINHVGGERVILTASNLTEYEFKRGHGFSMPSWAEPQVNNQTHKTLEKSIELVFGSQDDRVEWIGVTDGVSRQAINLASLYALTEALPVDLVPQAHQKYILDALYAMPFNPSVNIQLLIEILTLQLVAQDYAVRLLK